MLRCHPQLAADMVPDQLPQKGAVPVGGHVIKADSGTDKDLFNPGKLPQLPENPHIFPVVHPEISAGFGKQALAAGADSPGQLLLTGGGREVCGGP